ncbi:histidine phosphotransferase ChpT [Chenggangzhangella methanolivorans]|uniref:Histidine phosphotransferase n=1 Tax=Chenggangzhangella methanolivorans TaxID=1437009 RepID=A0A9E6UMJ5_9HYPH|nr:histidine phosphotransferase family protein [Chenggangzhangella methanolivorans]QZN99253.1 histidine phosphotransferase [Chenggangzhangella methanolivorans]
MSTSEDASTGAVITLDGLDLAALVASRVCHDVISPVGAIVNGLEILEDEKDEGMRGFAFDLIKKSAEQASARLQFCRIAFGAAGSAAAQLDLGDAEQVARGFVVDQKTSLVWEAKRQLLPKNIVKLLLNLVLVATTTIPRGGEIKVTSEGEGEATSFAIVTTGVSARVPANVLDLLAGRAPEDRVDAHVIQPFYAGLVARAANMTVTIEAEIEGEKIVTRARPAAA